MLRSQAVRLRHRPTLPVTPLMLPVKPVRMRMHMRLGRQGRVLEVPGVPGVVVVVVVAGVAAAAVAAGGVIPRAFLGCW